MQNNNKARIVIVISGNGSNAQTIMDACATQSIHAEVLAVISNKPTAYGLERAKQAGITATCVDHTKFVQRIDFDHALRSEIDRYQPDLVVLAGFMRILSEEFVKHYTGRLLNIHPSLLPKYPGLATHQRAIDNGDAEHGTSVHFVTAELDGGPVVLQAKVPIFKDDDSEALSARVVEQEHQVYSLVVKWFCAGRLTLQNGVAMLDGQALPEHGYANDD